MTQTERLILENQMAIIDFLLNQRNPIAEEDLRNQRSKTRKYLNESEQDGGH